MFTCLVGGLGFGIYRLVQLLDGKAAPVDLVISVIIFAIGLTMLVMYLRDRRLGPKAGSTKVEGIGETPSRRRTLPLPRLLALLLAAVSVALTVYWAVREEGLWRILVDHQNKFFGASYHPVTELLTWLILMIACLVPAVLFFKLTRWG